MKMFISHATKNKETILKFVELLKKTSNKIEVFCSSENGSIPVGKNFIKIIFNELDNSDLFIPIISKEYFESKFCMIELGVAYSYLYNKYSCQEEDYIFPFAMPFIKKGQALLGTPMANLQVGIISDEVDILSFLEYLYEKKGIYIEKEITKKLNLYVIEINKTILKQYDVLNGAKIESYFDDRIYFKHYDDIVKVTNMDNEITVDYNMNPYKRKFLKYPKFISLVLRYPDKLDMSFYTNINYHAEFGFLLTNLTNSLNRIFIEFKYSDNNQILDTFEFQLKHGENKLNINIEKIKSNMINNISEICFVIHPNDVNENGIFKISNIKIQ